MPKKKAAKKMAAAKTGEVVTLSSLDDTVYGSPAIALF